MIEAKIFVDGLKEEFFNQTYFSESAFRTNLKEPFVKIEMTENHFIMIPQKQIKLIKVNYI